ncbi:hypothetical protein [Marinilabilia salmonicolor]|nr:hypothetical protein [Marinilabilia salmonicolor]
MQKSYTICKGGFFFSILPVNGFPSLKTFFYYKESNPSSRDGLGEAVNS